MDKICHVPTRFTIRTVRRTALRCAAPHRRLPEAPPTRHATAPERRLGYGAGCLLERSGCGNAARRATPSPRAPPTTVSTLAPTLPAPLSAHYGTLRTSSTLRAPFSVSEILFLNGLLPMRPAADYAPHGVPSVRPCCTCSAAGGTTSSACTFSRSCTDHRRPSRNHA